MEKAIFLDRDGVINMERDDYTYRPEDFILNKGLLPALQRLQKAGYLLVVISNQSGIAKGIYDHAAVTGLHALFLEQCHQAGIAITGFYYCPHHPDHGLCLCRKPGSLMIEKALARWNIDPTRSYMIGDRPRDIEAAEKAGVKGLMVSSNTNPDAVVSEFILPA